MVALGWLVWAMWFQSNPDVQSSLRTFDVVDAHTVDGLGGAEASHDEDVHASCLVPRDRRRPLASSAS